MKLYISGPMSGLPGHNFEAFRAAAKKLTVAGYDVIDPSENFGGETHHKRSLYMREDISNVLKADALALLPGWSNSKGAALEVAIADELGLDTASVGFWVNNAGFHLRPGVTVGRVLNKGGVFSSDERYVNPDTQHGDGPLKSGVGVLYGGSVFKREWLDKAFKQETILEEAQRLVHGDRGASYGHPADDFGRTAALWNTLFADLLAEGKKFTAAHIPIGQIAVKLSRETNKPKRDNLTDICGYAETRMMTLEREGGS